MMAVLLMDFDLEDLKGFREALEKVEELRAVVPVEIQHIGMAEDGKLKIVLRVPADSLRLARETFPDAVVIA